MLLYFIAVYAVVRCARQYTQQLDFIDRLAAEFYSVLGIQQIFLNLECITIVSDPHGINMKVAFVAGRSIPIQATSLEERPLGGTETGLIRVAEELQQRGHEVTVFTSMAAPAPSLPRYLPADQLLLCGHFDVLIAVQEWRSLLQGAPCGKSFYWTGDGFDQYSNFGLGDKRVAEKIDKLLLVSNWHRDTLCERSAFPIQKTAIVGNGVHEELFEGSEQRVRKRLIYTAAPYRGLQLVPQIYLELKKRHPDLELHVFAGLNIYDREQPFRGPQLAEFRKLARVLKSLPGCILHGNVVQSQLARELMKSSVLIYPNFHYETCCITAIEAQAAGCPVVASFNSALPQTVDEAGALIPGKPGSAQYINDFIEQTDRLLSDDDYWSEASRLALARAKAQFSWAHVADRFESLFTN